MSFSFGVKAATKADAIAAAAAEMDKVVTAQTKHAEDAEVIKATVGSYINLLADIENKDIAVSVSGSLSWAGVHPGSDITTGANVSVSASLVDRAI